MQSVVWAAIGDYADYSSLRREIQQHKKKIHLVRESSFEIRTLGDARYLATFLANYYPDSQRVVLGISELLINAVEHGNLGITYAEKSRLNKEGRWEEKIEALQGLPENESKKVAVHFKRSDGDITLTIVDDGDGFDWQQYMKIDPDRATHSHGRGIALSNMLSFDSIEYRGTGNEVVCTFNT